jgi:putative flippase GtrA
MSNFWTFKLGNSQQVKKLSRYALLAVFNYIFGNLAMYGFIEYTNINHNIAKAFITITVVAWNFLLYKKWVFKEE